MRLLHVRQPLCVVPGQVQAAAQQAHNLLLAAQRQHHLQAVGNAPSTSLLAAVTLATAVRRRVDLHPHIFQSCNANYRNKAGTQRPTLTLCLQLPGRQARPALVCSANATL